MSAAVSVPTRYLVEWYLPVLSSQVVDDIVAKLDGATAGLGVSLLMTLSVPTDEVLYGVFAAESQELVEKACARAGVVPERLSIDVDARITQRF